MNLWRLITIVLLVLQFACASSHEPKVDMGIYRIVFAQGGCYGECPAEAFSIDTSLIVRYRGVEYVDSVGSFIGKISAETWNAIVSKCLKTNYHDFDTLHNTCVDAQAREVFIYDSAGSKHIMFQDCYMHARDSLFYFTEWLREIVLKSELQPQRDSLIFETQYQDPPPMVKVDTPLYFSEPDTK